MHRLAILPGLAVLLTVACAGRANAETPSGAEFFEKQVRPLLVERCLGCHGDKKPRGGLRLTSRAALLKGGDSGPAAVPGKPAESLLVQAVHYSNTPRMPPKEKLPERDIATLTRWVQAGLPWPESTPAPTAPGTRFTITQEQRAFWSLQPVGVSPPPGLKDSAGVRSPIDAFVRAKLEARGLKPAAPADARTLIRRLSFDLLGVPPSVEQVEGFVHDPSPDAYEKLVDQLLADPRYGERWGRHWLDLVRYTDSFDARGLGGEGDCSEAWRYRDWVIRALNADLPYDQFVRAQVAGDVTGSGEFDRDGTVATGMLAIGNWGGGDADKEKLLTDIVDDQIDVVSRTFLGVTLACARCHDHKFDPLSTADYYGLAGIFFSSHILPNVGPKTNGPPMLRIPLTSPAEVAQRKQAQEKLAALEKQLQSVTQAAYAEFARSQAAHSPRYLRAAREVLAGRPLSEEARKHDLAPFALERWVDLLSPARYPLLARPTRDVLGRKGVVAWRRGADTPNAVINTTAAEQSIQTFRLPPRSVSIHPGSTTGVAAAWRSPVTGVVRIEGRVADADPVCGDGVAWSLGLIQEGVFKELAAGELANGGAQALRDGKGGGKLEGVSVRAGDSLQLRVLPKASHACDTTVIDWTIRTVDGRLSWSLAADLASDPLASNPFPDRHGNASVWHLRDLDMRKDADLPGLADWRAVFERWREGRASEQEALEADEKLARGVPATGARSPYGITSPAQEKHLPERVRAELTGLRRQRDQLRAAPLPPVEFANGIQEGGVPGSPHAGLHDVRIHLRGRYDRLGELVPRRFPEVLAGSKQPPITKGSGRAELARWLTDLGNPLTARVIVNRLWQHHFGEGIVRTPSNFGKLGTPPSHPELLDWLAGELVRRHWSLKDLHRSILLSATYRQSSVPHPATLAADPDNLLFGRMSRRRLEAELLRDSLLSAAGRLDGRMGGPADRSPTSRRRGVYQMTVRSERSGFGPLFDAADSTAPVDHRTASTVAPQALYLLNNPFAVEQGKALAVRLQTFPGDDRARVTFAYQLLFARPPLPAEERVGLGFLAKAGGGRRAWEEYAQVLLCTNEFLYVD